jgi:uncharacterized RDD family membrane protein YckC
VTRNAPFISRAIAFLLDVTAICCALGLTILAVVAGLAGSSVASDDLTMGQVLLLSLVFVLSVLVIPPFYFTFLTCYEGQTLGKWFMGIRAVDSEGRPMSALRAFFRFNCYVLSALPFLAGFLLALVAPGRSLHDLLAGTRVMEEE